jgi:uncharacterized HhH-GPD family protein
MAAPDRLWFTENDEANKLLAEDPFALLVGFALDQQITVQQAFQGPLRIKQRVGTLDPKTLATIDLEPAFREKPAVHRFPGTMAARVHELAASVADEYDGDASRIWRDAEDGADLKKRLMALPGFGDMKVRSMTAVLAKRFGVEAAREVAPNHPTLGDVDSAQSLLDYQAAKREYKRSKSGR